MILDDFKTALDRMRDYWFQKQVRGDDIILHGGDGHRRLGYSGRAAGDEDYDIEMMSNGAQQGGDFGKGTSDSFPRVYTRDNIARIHV